MDNIVSFETAKLLKERGFKHYDSPEEAIDDAIKICLNNLLS